MSIKQAQEILDSLKNNNWHVDASEKDYKEVKETVEESAQKFLAAVGKPASTEYRVVYAPQYLKQSINGHTDYDY